jgi:hypothetical protein
MGCPLAFVEEYMGCSLAYTAFALAFAEACMDYPLASKAFAFAYMGCPLAWKAFALASRACIEVEVPEEQGPERVRVYIEVDLARELERGKVAELALDTFEEQAQECTNQSVTIS